TLILFISGLVLSAFGVLPIWLIAQPKHQPQPQCGSLPKSSEVVHKIEPQPERPLIPGTPDLTPEQQAHVTSKIERLKRHLCAYTGESHNSNCCGEDGPCSRRLAEWRIERELEEWKTLPLQQLA